jgi:hypothetical protein
MGLTLPFGLLIPKNVKTPSSQNGRKIRITITKLHTGNVEKVARGITKEFLRTALPLAKLKGVAPP